MNNTEVSCTSMTSFHSGLFMTIHICSHGYTLALSPHGTGSPWTQKRKPHLLIYVHLLFLYCAKIYSLILLIPSVPHHSEVWKHIWIQILAYLKPTVTAQKPVPLSLFSFVLSWSSPWPSPAQFNPTGPTEESVEWCGSRQGSGLWSQPAVCICFCQLPAVWLY